MAIRIYSYLESIGAEALEERLTDLDTKEAIISVQLKSGWWYVFTRVSGAIGNNWEISDETRHDIKEIDDNARAAAINADQFVAGHQ